MKKIASVLAAVGMMAALSASAFAAELPAASNGAQPMKNAEVGVTELGVGVSTDDVASCILFAPGDEEYVANAVDELGDGVNVTDVAKDIVVAP